jgi:hypothetical protein
MSMFAHRVRPGKWKTLIRVILVGEPVPLKGSERPRRGCRLRRACATYRIVLGLCRLVRESATTVARRIPPPRPRIPVYFSRGLGTAYAVIVLVAGQSCGSGAEDAEDRGN